MPTSVRSVLLHICAEAVTNAVRHGTSPRSLRVVVHSGRVELDCRNRCLSPAQTGPAETGPAQSTTLGLRTMDNRARALGGEVVAGTCGERPDTWMVQARLPLHTTGHGVP